MDVTLSNLEAGMAAVRAGQKEQARTHLLRVLSSNPRHETAWLWLSGVMPTTEQALRCVEHLLTINPQHQRALEARDVLQVQLLLQEAASDTDTSPSTPQRRYLLGEALVEARLLTQAQLDEALRRQAELAQRSKPMRLGELLIKLKVVTKEQLMAALTAQIESMAPVQGEAQGTRFGEFLVAQGILTRAQLHQGLAAQADARRRGKAVPLGEVLVRCGYLERLVLHHMLLEWHHQMIVQDEQYAAGVRAN
jgi:hypothetical protein